MVLIKENHIRAAGSITAAVALLVVALGVAVARRCGRLVRR